MHLRSILARRVSLVGLAVLTVAAGGVAVQEEPPDLIDECVDPDADWCLEDRQNGASPAPGETPGGGQPDRDVPECGWVTISAGMVPAETSSRPAIFTNGRPPDGTEVIWQGWCVPEVMPPGTAFRGPFRWLPVDDPVLEASAEDVAQNVYDSIRGQLPEPVVVTSPPVGVDAVVGVPVFVSVVNWQAQVIESRPLLGETVTVTATPDVVINAAEPGAGPVVCVGPGRGYDPSAGDLWVQAAAPGACTCTYQRRTGIGGRPNAWPSMALVRWSIGWSSTSGEGGTFPVVEQPVSIARSVTEVQAVVVGGGG